MYRQVALGEGSASATRHLSLLSSRRNVRLYLRCGFRYAHDADVQVQRALDTPVGWDELLMPSPLRLHFEYLLRAGIESAINPGTPFDAEAWLSQSLDELHSLVDLNPEAAFNTARHRLVWTKASDASEPPE